MAIKLRGVQCNAESEKMAQNDIVCAGTRKYEGRILCYLGGQEGPLLTRCKMSQADAAFMFLTAIVVAGAAGMGWIRMKRGY